MKKQRNIKENYDSVYDYATYFLEGDIIKYKDDNWEVIAIDSTEDGFATPLLCENIKTKERAWLSPYYDKNFKGIEV